MLEAFLDTVGQILATIGIFFMLAIAVFLVLTIYDLVGFVPTAICVTIFLVMMYCNYKKNEKYNQYERY